MAVQVGHVVLSQNGNSCTQDMLNKCKHTHARATADMDMLNKSSCTGAENCVLVAPQGNNRVANRQLIATLSNKPCLLVLDSLKMCGFKS